MKTRLSLLMVLALLAALSATSVTRADGPVTGGGTGAGGRQTFALPSILPGQPAGNDVAAANVAAGANVAPAAQSHAGQEARPFETNRQLAPWQPPALQGAETTYFVEWNITASGESDIQGSGYREITKRNIQIRGGAVVHEPAIGKVKTIPMNLIIADDLYINQRSKCSDDHEWRSITDGYRYYGGPDPFWAYPGMFLPQQRADGSWYMDNPFSDWAGFTVNGDLARTFNYRTDTKDYDLCGSNDYSGSYTNEMMYYDDILPPLRNMPLELDPTGTVFRLINRSYTVQTTYGPPLTVYFNATVRLGGGCEDLPAPIDISNPGLTFLALNLQAEDTTPDGEATLQARVTCQGVPVINAPVVVRLKVVERSGGHDHVGGKRPRGYIDGVEQTANTKFIGITDSDGAVTFAIRPGRDLTDKSRGIAGWYIVDAWVEWQGLTSTTERAYINAHLDLIPAPEEPEWYLFYRPLGMEGHPKETYGTPVTVEGIHWLGAYWITKQMLHNDALARMGKPRWPILRLRIWAISLPQGGLFDERAFVPNYMWRTPFRHHRTGEDAVFMSPFYEDLWMPIEHDLWYQRIFRDLGNRWGTWFSESGNPLHLNITGAHPLESSMLALSKSASTDPDVAASAALVNPEGRIMAGAGQTVTYAVGVENVVSGTVASQVVLKSVLPAGLNFVSADPIQSRMEDPRTPVWDVGSLPEEGAPRAFGVVARVDPSLAAGTVLTVTATATTSSHDTDPANNQFSAWGLTVQQPGPDLVIGSNLNATALVVREPVTFTIQLGNEGNASASNSWFDLTVPAGITITETIPAADVIPGGVRWDAGILAPGEALTATVDLQVDPGLLDLAALSPDLEPEYPLSFSMAAGSDDSDIDPASNQMQVDKRVELPGPDLLVALQADGTPGPGLFEVGQIVTYTLRYANFGNREAGEVSAALLLWPGLALMESQPAPTTDQLDPGSGVRTLTWDLGELSTGEEGTIEVWLRVDDVPEAGSIIQANISSSSIDLNPADNVVMETRYEANASNEGEYKIYLPVVERQ